MILTTTLDSYVFVDVHLKRLEEAGHTVFYVASPESFEACLETRSKKLHFFPVKMSRAITPFKDMLSFLRLLKLVWKVKPHVLHYTTPKASLLASCVGLLLGVKIRVYHLGGLRLEQTQGWLKYLLWMSEKLTIFSSTYFISVSQSLAQVYEDFHLLSKDRIQIFGQGSVKGVNLKKFSHENIPQDFLDEFSQRLHLNSEVKVLGFVGRINRDKGIIDLFHLWEKIRSQQLRLFILGSLDESDDEVMTYFQKLKSDPLVFTENWNHSVERYLAGMQLLLMPSYREGFGQVVIEAAAMGVPTLAYRSTGLIDSVVDQSTGILVKRGDWISMSMQIKEILNSPTRYDELVNNAKKWAQEHFDERVCSEYVVNFYRSISLDRP